MKKNEWNQIARCSPEIATALVQYFRVKYAGRKYEFKVLEQDATVVCMRGIGTEHEFHYFDCFCSGFVTAKLLDK
jgi:hypothetical protein